ncbi:MAG TPA: hypothetical protein VIL05_07390 [Thermoclostridium sp.]
MKLNVAVKYRLYDNKKAILIFYIVIVSVLAFMFLFSALNRGNHKFNGSIQGLELASAIFLFVVGLNSFKEIFRMFMQNGISRKTMFLSYVASTAAICIIMAFIDSILALISRSITAVNGGIYSRGVIEMMYGKQVNSIGTFLLSIILCFFINIAFTSLGFFITTLYYRMNKTQKITVSIGVPALLFVILPIADTLLLNGIFFTGLAGILTASFRDPFMCMLSCFVLSGVLMALSWMLVRKAAVKD